MEPLPQKRFFDIRKGEILGTVVVMLPYRTLKGSTRAMPLEPYFSKSVDAEFCISNSLSYNVAPLRDTELDPT